MRTMDAEVGVLAAWAGVRLGGQTPKRAVQGQFPAVVIAVGRQCLAGTKQLESHWGWTEATGRADPTSLPSSARVHYVQQTFRSVTTWARTLAYVKGGWFEVRWSCFSTKRGGGVATPPPPPESSESSKAKNIEFASR